MVDNRMGHFNLLFTVMKQKKWLTTVCTLLKRFTIVKRGSYMSAHVLLNLLNEFGNKDKMRGLPSILSLFRNEFNKFNNTGA